MRSATLSGPGLPIIVFRALFNYGRRASAAPLMTDATLQPTTGGTCTGGPLSPASNFITREAAAAGQTLDISRKTN